MVEAMSANGPRHGPAVTYYDNGQKRTEGEFRNGAYHGRWQGWYSDGKLQKNAVFNEGKEISREEFPYPE